MRKADGETALTVPTVHLNGTSQGVLLEGYAQALVELDDAIRAVTEYAAPNGRDYYLQGPNAYAQAADEHCSRLRRLNSVRDELLALYEAVENGRQASGRTADGEEAQS